MKLYLANTSKQHHLFIYRPADRPETKPVEIPAGTQVQIGGDNMSDHDIDRMLRQHAPYGLTAVKDLPRTAGYIGLVYSIDKPVNMDQFMSTFEKNDIEMNANAADRRESAAAAIADGMSKSLGIPVQRTEVELTEESKSGTPSISEGHEVIAENMAPRHPGKKGRRSKREN